MLSLPESWELPPCEALMLLLETQQQQEIRTHRSTISTRGKRDPPGQGPRLFSRRQNADWNHNTNPTALQGLHIELQAHHPLHPVLAGCWQEPFPSPGRETKARGQGHGWLWHSQTSAWCLQNRDWGVRAHRDTQEVQIQPQKCQLYRKTWQLSCSHLDTMCAWTWGRELFLAFWKPGWPALSPTQLTSSTKASGSFSESLFLAIGPWRPQLMTKRRQPRARPYCNDLSSRTLSSFGAG